MNVKAMGTHTQPPQYTPGGQTHYPPHNFDSSGQVAPPGVKPRVTATLWEDEGSLCFQVEAKGVCVARREGTFLQLQCLHMQMQMQRTFLAWRHMRGIHLTEFPDNHFINGTKLLNVAGMTRGRRDGILKSEKTRHVVKIGPMHLKGVW